MRFQSTRPVWGATRRSVVVSTTDPHFNPRAPCGARRPCAAWYRRRKTISIHAPRVGRDFTANAIPYCTFDFNPRAPCGARPDDNGGLPFFGHISIHAPRVGRDELTGWAVDDPSIISIHAPRVGRDSATRRTPPAKKQYQYTRPVWGATFGCRHRMGPMGFQSTRPVWGATVQQDFVVHKRAFQSTRPVWGATANLTILPRQICTKGTKEFLLGRKTHGKKEKQSKSLLTFTHFRPFWGAKVPELSARLYFAPNTARLSARLRHHSPLWHRNARCGCDTYPQGSKSAGCPRIHP